MRSLQLSRYRNQFDKCAMKSQAITECSALETGQTQDIISGWWETHTQSLTFMFDHECTQTKDCLAIHIYNAVHRFRIYTEAVLICPGE